MSMKDLWVKTICDRLEQGSYSCDSEVFKTVKTGLRKLSRDELQGLYAILTTLPLCQCPK